MKEIEIQKQIIEYLRKSGFMVWRNTVQGGKHGGGGTHKAANKGSPDVMALRDGVFYGIEVKKPGGKVSTDQIAWLAFANQHGAKCFVARSLGDVVDFLVAEKVLPKPESLADITKTPLFY